MPLLLDLSAAFDTIDHNILITRLSSWFGIHGSVLSWFKSYLSSRPFRDKYDNNLSSLTDKQTNTKNVKPCLPSGGVRGPSSTKLGMVIAEVHTILVPRKHVHIRCTVLPLGGHENL